MRILQMNPAFYPAMAYGGTVEVAYQLSRELARRGHQVTVYTSDTLDKYHRQRSKISEIDGIRVYYFRNFSNALAWHRLIFTPGMLLQLRKEARNFDVIHLHGSRNFQNIVVHHYAKKYGIPYVLQAHGSLPRIMAKQRLKRVFDVLWGYRILSDAAKVIAVTQMEVEQYKSMGVSEDKIEIVPNGIDLTEFDNLPQRGEFRRKHGLDDSQKIVLYLGRIHKIKGLDLLAMAFDELAKEIDNIKLVIVGPDDGYLPALKELISELGIEELVLLTGPLYGEDKLTAYVDADVYVLPSVYETFPVAVLEAGACGTPVIVTDRCGIADVIDGQAGLAVPYNEEQLSSAILRMLSDNTMSREFSEKGSLLVREQFNWEKIAEQIENLYLSCLSSSC